ncbi:DUF6221 family protein [Streptomyces sp. NPDC097619]|uniref:DUF6221 family protein n=1 Tax=Streptomyces sp. NPDC097619 TaxID=3157228 RepID=UPI0033326836
MDDLVEFLRARLRQDAEDARTAAVDGSWAAARVMAQAHAARLLVDASVADCPPECATGRGHGFGRACALHRMGPVHEEDGQRWLYDDTGARFPVPPVTTEWTLRVLALPYSAHPDYRSHWRP